MKARVKQRKKKVENSPEKVGKLQEFSRNKVGEQKKIYLKKKYMEKI